MNIRNKNLCILIGFIVFSLLFIYAKKLSFIPVYWRTKDHIQYDSRSYNPKINKPFDWSAGNNFLCKLSSKKSIKMSGSFEMYTLSDWQNLFQTAPVNEGLRLEINSAGKAGFVLGVLQRNNLAEFSGFPFPFIVQPKKAYDLEIKGTTDDIFETKIDNQVLPTGFLEVPFSVSRIKVGEGFSKERTFDGKITDFSVSFTCYIGFSWLAHVWRLLALGGWLFCAFLFLRGELCKK